MVVKNHRTVSAVWARALMCVKAVLPAIISALLVQMLGPVKKEKNALVL